MNKSIFRIAHIALASGVVVMTLLQPVAATSPPAPPEPTIREIVESTQAVFVGKVMSTTWRPILPGSSNAGTIELDVSVTTLLMGDTRVIPTRLTYVGGTVSMSEAQAKARYDGKSFVFAGDFNQQGGGKPEIALPPSGKPPFDLFTKVEFMREIARLHGMCGPGGCQSSKRYSARSAHTCAALEALAKKRGGLERQLIEIERLAGFDVDGDGHPDSISVGCPGSDPTTQADPCIVDVQTTKAPPYSLSAWRVFIIEHDKQPLAIVSGQWIAGKPPRERDVYRFGSSGATKVCTIQIGSTR